MNLDKALDELNRAPDLATPSLPGLAYLLRHPELWPKGFVWNYRCYFTCAVGLAAQVWHGDAMRSWTIRTFDLDHSTHYHLFSDSSRPDHRPTDVATRIDRFLATTEF